MSKYPNSGVLSKNERKETEKHPDANGIADIICPHCKAETAFWISGWLKVGGPQNKRFTSLAFKPKDEQRQPETRSNHDIDDDIPF